MDTSPKRVPFFSQGFGRTESRASFSGEAFHFSGFLLGLAQGRCRHAPRGGRVGKAGAWLPFGRVQLGALSHPVLVGREKPPTKIGEHR